MFKEVIRICDKYNINYFIIGGTLLGAIRHKGFIPWDDDLDIGMTRDDYNKFMDVASKELGDEYILQTFFTEENTPFYFAKVRKKNTKFIEEYCKDLDINHGIFIDIFPYDNIPDDKKLRDKQQRKVNFWSQLFIAKSVKGISNMENSLKGKIKKMARMFLHYFLKPVSKNYLFLKLDAACQEYNNVKCKMKSFVKYPYLMIPSEDLINLERVEFEGIYVNCPGHPRDYLKHHYGDFMKLPLKEKRVGHRPYKLEV
ncbi:LicD family protein [Thermoclostridium stercorarium]|uniref:LicD family protein n=1 Tax=Thermoclostridium stercorarium TaxID=1510 RepID=UPI0023B78E00|nr:LicD family protein [Thermoclostridium stercorarium]